ncbi:MAG: class I SAM-dependent RNA methyltransferase [Sphaerochaetaceae bacterium]|jgi:23S rRNA (uracil1939-C5)-methyltransferase|nr:class I SAM-dependent RNA methyltransferase [Sphaerochaetaceae bacterium]NLO60712.1 class I SAM-dependent RNA methyltransferase [Spirochaetales bacterium]MDD2406637.1 class I SAM-dependent RNA methyltransferase [Sphaerochaetaceae bacterium]MDD3669658.1 class I SAM-dependent RNA methyltransferase [Sphaerochaetaceae bacterium]MDD4258373.1 class I SAM-dependent RNA methyltransferase [Sphaerochaetaceae bacterium]
MQQIEVTIEKLIEGGDGLAHYDGKAVFIPQSLPQEKVLASIIEDKSDFSRAIVDEILEPSNYRVDPCCPYYGICGGCDFQHVKASAQAEFKQSLCFENLKRIGQFDIEDADITILPVATGPSLGYRSRIRFHVDVDEQRAGFLAATSNTLVDIDHCPVATERLNRLLGEKRPLLMKAATMRRVQQGWQRRTPFIEVPAFEGDTKVSLSNFIVHVTVLDKVFAVDSNAFFQTNRFVLPEMVDFVRSHAVGNRVMDLYSGVGLFAAFLEEPGREVIAVERNERALELARKNLSSSTQLYTQSVEHWSRSQNESVDTVVVDPPRSGLGGEVVDAISSWEPKVVIYVSCNSVTLARDIKRFAQSGYKPKLLQVFDVYPQTSHVETVVMLSR